MLSRIPITLAAVAGLSLATSGGVSADEAEYFDGKTVTYIVATGAGGGFDFFGRLTAQYMEKHVPGSTFIVRNMPGAGHIIGTNYIYHSKPDGLTMGTFNTAMALNQIVGKKGVKYDLAKMDFLGKASGDAQVVMISTKLPYKTIKDIRESGKTLKMATGGPGSGRWISSRITETIFGVKFRMIPGYTGPDAHLAMMRGEIDIMMGSTDSNAPMVEQDKGRFLLSYSTKRQKGYPNVPTAYEATDDPDEKKLANLVTVYNEIYRVTAVPPELPKPRLAYLRAAYKAAVEDPGYKEAVEKAGREYLPMYGEEVDAAIADVVDVSPRVKQLLTAAVNATAEFVEHTGKVTKTERDGRKIFLMHDGEEVSAKISGSRTKVTIGGKPGKRKNVKAGQTCTFVYIRPGAEAKELNCE